VRVDELDTPVPTVDLDAVERNIARMQGYCDEHGFDFRPHVKTHKVPELARMQLDAGAVGITCQKLGEAEVMADAGIDDILLSFPLLGAAKAERLAALARRVRIAVVGDSAEVARSLSPVLAREGVEVGFLVECDTGFRRTGVQTPAAAAELARLAASPPGLRFAGLMTYPTVPESGPWLRAARQAIEADGLEVERVSGGGTPTAFRTHEVGEITEIRWLTVREALAAGQSGRLQLRNPTVKNLELLDGAATAAEALGRLRGRRVETIRPRVIGEGESRKILMPGDPGYF